MPQTSHAAAHTGAAFSPLLIEKRGPVDWVTLNRPDSLNALDRTMIDALNEYFDARERDTDTRFIVLRGAGRGFCAGLDLKAKRESNSEVVGSTPNVEATLASQRRITSIVLKMRRCPQVIISLIHGAAAGGGFAIALASDMRIAARGARMNCAFIKLGLGGCDIGSSYFLPRLVGVSVASETDPDRPLHQCRPRLCRRPRVGTCGKKANLKPQARLWSPIFCARRRSGCGCRRIASTSASMRGPSSRRWPWKIATSLCACSRIIFVKASQPFWKSARRSGQRTEACLGSIA